MVLALVGYGGWCWISGPRADAGVEGELAVVEVGRTQPGQMEKNAIGQGLKPPPIQHLVRRLTKVQQL